MNAQVRIATAGNQQQVEFEHVPQVVESFCKQFGIPFDAMCDVQVAVDEILANVIKHEHHPSGSEITELRLDIRDGRLRVCIESCGSFFDSTQVAPPTDLHAPPAQRAVGHLGIYLAKQLMNEVSFRREGNKNILLMEKSLEK